MPSIFPLQCISKIQSTHSCYPLFSYQDLDAPQSIVHRDKVQHNPLLPKPLQYDAWVNLPFLQVRFFLYDIPRCVDAIQQLLELDFFHQPHQAQLILQKLCHFLQLGSSKIQDDNPPY